MLPIVQSHQGTKEDCKVNDRYSSRKNERGKVTLTVNGLVGEGILLNISVPGALIETGVPLATGQFVHIRLTIAMQQIRVNLAAVRWVNGPRAGIEFIRMSEEDQARLRWYVGFVEKRRVSTRQWSEAVICSGFSGI
jgi:hypothetical protein